MKNKRVKQMICDVVLKGRKAFWHGDESEVFVAKSFEQINDEFELDETADERGNLVSANWRYFWRPCLCEKEWNSKTGRYITKGSPAYSEEFEILPLICGVYGDSQDVATLLTSYN